MKTIGERVKARREQLRMSLPQLAKKVGGISHQAIQKLETGPGGTRHLVSLARALEVSPEWLQDGTGAPPLPPESINPQKISILSHPKSGVEMTNRQAFDEPSKELLKVLGMVEGGKDGWNILNGETVQYIDRPDNLRGVPGAYGVYVTGTSMEPRYHPGEILHVHPGRPVLPGAYVIVQKRNTDGDPPPGRGEAPGASVGEPDHSGTDQPQAGNGSASFRGCLDPPGCEV